MHQNTFLLLRILSTKTPSPWMYSGENLWLQLKQEVIASELREFISTPPSLFGLDRTIF